MSIGRFCTLLVLSAALAGLLFAQSDVQVQRVELTQPGGAIFGKLMTLGDQLVFVDDNQVNASFSIRRGDIRNMSTQGGVLTIELSQPVRDRSGQTYRLAFRMGSTDALENWWRGNVSNGRPSAPAPQPAQGSQPAQSAQPAQTGPAADTHV
jgi:hypothetical protein